MAWRLEVRMSPSSPQALPIPVASSSRVRLASLRAVRSRGRRTTALTSRPAGVPGRPLPGARKTRPASGKALLGAALCLRAILEDGQNGEIHRLALPHQQARRKAIFLYIIFEFLQLRRQPLPVAGGAEGQLPRHQGRQAGEAVQQQLVPLLTPGGSPAPGAAPPALS